MIFCGKYMLKHANCGEYLWIEHEECYFSFGKLKYKKVLFIKKLPKFLCNNVTIINLDEYIW